MSEIHFDRELDTSGLNCPLPVVKARKEIGALELGQVLKVISTDRGSMKDFEGWAKIDKRVDLLAQETEAADGGNLYIHFLQRSN